MSLEVPESSLSTEDLARLASFDRELAEAVDRALSGDSLDIFSTTEDGLVPASGAAGGTTFLRDDGVWSTVVSGAPIINVKDPAYDAQGDWNPTTETGTDDLAAINLAIAAVLAAGPGAELVFPPGQYYVSSRINLTGLRGVKVRGSAFATIVWRSGDTGLVGSGSVSDEMARAAFLMTNCTGVCIENLFGIGQDVQNLTSNIGSFIYETKCQDTTMSRCHITGGYGLHAQDATTGTSGTGDSISVTAGLVTLTDAAGAFSTGQVGRAIAISGMTNTANNGFFVVVARPSATTIQYRNVHAVNETSSFSYTIDDGDKGTHIELCHSYNQRGFTRTGSHSTITRCIFERPTQTLDATGIGDAFSLSGSTITFTDVSGKFRPWHVGKYITIASATTPGNNGRFLITGYTSANVITFTNASGATEMFTGTWWVANGEKTALGAGVSALTKVSNTMTVTVDRDTFVAADVGRIIRIADATTTANEIAAVITAVGSATTASFTNASGVAENFTGIITVDRYDNGVETDTYGSTHGIYVFAGRIDITIENCKFIGIRTTPVKISGSSAVIRNIRVKNCSFLECGHGIEAGADDSNEHSALIFEGNVFVDCGTQRPGASLSHVIAVLGARNVTVNNNVIYFTRNAIGSVDGRGVSGIIPVTVTRHTVGVSQPIEDVHIIHNKMMTEPGATSLGGLGPTAIEVSHVGQRAKWRSNGTLSKSGTTMTMFDGAAKFTQQDVGKTLVLVNCTGAGNDGTFIIKTVSATHTITFENAAGTTASSVGTYRIQEHSTFRGGECLIAYNQIHNIAEIVIKCTENVGPQIIGNMWKNGVLELNSDVSPTIAHNREIGTYTQTARIRLKSGVSWPVVYDNLIINNAIGSASGRDMGVTTNSAREDFPLLGYTVRLKPTMAKQQVLFSYGARWIDGDTVQITDSAGTVVTTFTYKASAPGANQFNSFSSLAALFVTAGYTAIDYGAQFSPSVTTTHMLIAEAAASAADGNFGIKTNCLAYTAGVLLRNDDSNSTICFGRGAGSAGPIADRLVAWSQANTMTSVLTLEGANATGRALLAGNKGATGTITCVANGSMADTDYITIGDGLVAPKLYEYDKASDGVTAGRVQWAVAGGGGGASDVAATLKTAIDANQPSISVTNNGDGTLSLSHKIGGTVGNVTITENVANAGFLVSGMSGGTTGGYRQVKNQYDGGCNSVVLLGTTDGTEEFRAGIIS